MLRRCAARNSEDTSCSGRFCVRWCNHRSNSSWSVFFIFFPITKVQIVQLLPKLFRGTKQMHFHSSNIQVQDLGYFGQAPIFIMPQCECGALAETEPFERACE